MRSIGIMAAVLIAGSFAVVGAADKVETPKAVTAAIMAAFPEAKIAGAKPGHEGIDIWEVDFELAGKKVHGDVTPDGTLIETEDRRDEMKDFPEAAQAAIKKAAVGATIKGYAIVTRYAVVDAAAKTAKKLDAPVKIYEADLAKGDKATEVGVSADGKVVQAPAWE